MKQLCKERARLGVEHTSCEALAQRYRAGVSPSDLNTDPGYLSVSNVDSGLCMDSRVFRSDLRPILRQASCTNADTQNLRLYTMDRSEYRLVTTNGCWLQRGDSDGDILFASPSGEVFGQPLACDPDSRRAKDSALEVRVGFEESQDGEQEYTIRWRKNANMCLVPTGRNSRILALASCNGSFVPDYHRWRIDAAI